MRRVITHEERVAKKIADLLADSRLDLDKVGKEFALGHSFLIFRRLECVTEAAIAEKEDFNERYENEFREQMSDFI